MLPDEFYVSGEAEKLHGLKAAAIHLLGDGQHRPGSHPQRPEAQLTVAKCRIDDTNLVQHFLLSSVDFSCRNVFSRSSVRYQGDAGCISKPGFADNGLCYTFTYNSGFS